MLVRLLLSSLWSKLDEVVNSEDCDGCLGGELERFDLGDGGFEDAGLLVVPHHALVEVQAAVLQVSVLLLGLRRVVVGAELGHQVGSILGGIDRQGLGDDQQGLGEVSDGQLFSTGQGCGKVLKVNRQSSLQDDKYIIWSNLSALIG